MERRRSQSLVTPGVLVSLDEKKRDLSNPPVTKVNVRNLVNAFDQLRSDEPSDFVSEAHVEPIRVATVNDASPFEDKHEIEQATSRHRNQSSDPLLKSRNTDSKWQSNAPREKRIVKENNPFEDQIPDSAIKVNTFPSNSLKAASNAPSIIKPSPMNPPLKPVRPNPSNSAMTGSPFAESAATLTPPSRITPFFNSLIPAETLNTNAPKRESPFNNQHSNKSHQKEPPRPPPRPKNSQHETGMSVGELTCQLESVLQNHTIKSTPEFKGLKSLFFREQISAFLVMGNLVCVAGLASITLVSLTDASKRTIELPENKKIHSLFHLTFSQSNQNRILVGSDKDIYEVCTHTFTLLNRYAGIHLGAVTNIFRCKLNEIISIDDQGRICFWTAPSNAQRMADGESFKIKNAQDNACIVNGMLWTSSLKLLTVYSIKDRLTAVKAFDLAGIAGNICCLCSCEARNLVISGHEDGKYVIWDANRMSITKVCNLSSYKIICCVVAYSKYVWLGQSTGKIQILDLDALDRPAFKEFDAHPSTLVVSLKLNTSSFLFDSGLPVIASLGADGQVKFWDSLLIKDKIESRLWLAQSSYSTHHPLSLQIISWNINAIKAFELEDVRFWDTALKIGAQAPDVLVIGFQEMVDLESSAVNTKILFKKDTDNQVMDERSKQWQYSIKVAVDRLLADGVAHSAGYRIVECRQLVGLFQIVLVKSVIKVNDCSSVLVKTGLGGYHGNKGAIVTRLIIEDSSLCIVNCHLAAHQKEISSRNSDCHAILKEGTVKAFDSDTCFMPGSNGIRILVSLCFLIDGKDSEIVFWYGDMNYRIDVGRSQALDLIKTRSFNQLLKYDQLNRQFESNPSFALKTFSESNIDFAPTFKYDVQSNEYDTSEKKRIPAWCDRILWKGAVKCEYYNRLEFMNSDHRPVTGLYTFSVKSVEKAQRDQVLHDLASKLEHENQSLFKQEKVFWLIETLNLDYDTSMQILERNQWILRLESV